MADELKDLGGGWYRTPSGTKVQGREQAEAQLELEQEMDGRLEAAGLEDADARELGIEVGEWHGRPNYTCGHCPHADLDLGRMREHVILTHLPPPEPAPAPTIIQTDRFGNELRPEEG